MMVSAVLIYTKIHDPGAWLIAKGRNPAPGLVYFVNCSLSAASHSDIDLIYTRWLFMLFGRFIVPSQSPGSRGEAAL